MYKYSKMVALSAVLTISLTMMQALATTTTAGEVTNPEKVKWPQVPTVQVTMWNNMQGRQDMRVHCKSASEDFWVQPLLYHQTYEFKFDAVGYQDDYYCSFDFDGVLHWFDIYLGKRDRNVCGEEKQKLCRWVIMQNGPCLIDTSTCYPWNHDGKPATLPLS